MITMSDIGIRPNAWWGKYREPFKFNIFINDMRDVMKHEDIPLAAPSSFGIQSSSVLYGYRISAKK